MRIANDWVLKNKKSALRRQKVRTLFYVMTTCISLAFICLADGVSAQTVSMPTSSSPMPNMAPAPIGAPAASASNLPGMSPPAASDPSVSLPPKPQNADMTKAVSGMEEKVSDSAKGVLNKLDKSSDAMTLEDLNEAHQTVARIEALIDIEKHLSELDKIRKERSGEGTGSSLASAIPASALMPHMPMMPYQAMPPSNSEPVHRSLAAASLQISRIIGTDGRYSAVLKLANGDRKSVHVGDQIEPGITVQAISSSSVTLDEGGKVRSLHIKNVDAIYSAMR